jgi:uncharacterized protein YacL
MTSEVREEADTEEERERGRGRRGGRVYQELRSLFVLLLSLMTDQ